MNGSYEGLLLISFMMDNCICNPYTRRWTQIPSFKDVLGFYKSSDEFWVLHVRKDVNLVENRPTQSEYRFYIYSLNSLGARVSRCLGCPTPSNALKVDMEENAVPPAQRSATTSLRIDRFVRPFTLKAVQELLGRTGSVCSFWMDHIMTHCYVTYSSVEEAVATKNAVYNLQWPPNNSNYLIAEFVDIIYAEK
ncbi:hypothetical protein C2845_PM13G22180 [Panicum miliaceum]|uniref:RRM domain-containing protein n=1 Tax=Panicum miliaceum TaxID=4540 RepID=A0A3L6RKL7_PANMI|nr:hypothetical protein C2845_PM13G22180 [Panicum miliaceum]